MTGSTPSAPSSTHTITNERGEHLHVSSSSFNEKHVSDIEELPIQQLPTAESDKVDEKVDEGKKKKKGKKEKKKKEPSVPIYRLFRFATAADKLMIFVAVIFSMGIGALQPATIIIFGNFLGQVCILSSRV